jgi:ABC-type branched-subunit amino acid transport system substrate-binding protein
MIDANAATAQNVVSTDNGQKNVAVIGHMCSSAFANTCPNTAVPTALSIYENAGIVTINGSTTAPCLPSVGPHVFDGVAVPGDDFDKWYSAVQALQSDTGWRAAYATKFGKSATQFADLYYDATNLLLTRLTEVSKIESGKLVIDRAELAKAVRNTTDFCGVTGTLSLDAGGYRINATAPC